MNLKKLFSRSLIYLIFTTAIVSTPKVYIDISDKGDIVPKEVVERGTSSIDRSSPSPYPITLFNGEDSITIIAKGSEYRRWTETSKEGYVVKQNSSNLFEFVTYTNDSTTIELSGVIATNSKISILSEESKNSNETTLEIYSTSSTGGSSDNREMKFLKSTDLKDSDKLGAGERYLSTNRESTKNEFRSINIESSRSESAGSSSVSSIKVPILTNQTVPSSGTINVLCILMEYKDLPRTYSRDEFEDLLNEVNYNGTGSFRDFYLDISNGQLDVNIDVVGWYESEQNYREYEAGDYEDVNAQTLLLEGVEQAYSDGVDFSKYDNDNDGDVDGVFMIHAGIGAEEANQTQYIWSHRWALEYGIGSVVYNGITVNDYLTTPELRSYTQFNITGIGTLCHEFGHNLGLPDLYSTDGSSEGIGEWGLMGGGSWLGNEAYPANMTAMCKLLLDWATPEKIVSSGEYTLTPYSESYKSYFIPILDDNGDEKDNEFFILENRQKSSIDLELPGEGLAIWHIDTDIDVNGSDIQNVTSHKFMDLEEADGLNHLDSYTNRGDSGDLYPFNSSDDTFSSRSNENNIFSPVSDPQSISYTNTFAKYDISDITENSSNILFTIKEEMHVVASIDNNGTVTPEYQTVTSGDDISLEITSSLGYRVDEVYLNNVDISDMVVEDDNPSTEGRSYTLTVSNITTDITIDIYTVEEEYTIITQTTDTPPSIISTDIVTYGSPFIETITPPTDQYVKEVLFNGATISLDGNRDDNSPVTISLDNISSDGTIDVTFENYYTESYLYPNPVTDGVLHVVTPTFKSYISLTIYSIDGGVVYKNSNFSDSEVNISNLKSGIYIVYLEEDGVRSTFKIIKTS